MFGKKRTDVLVAGAGPVGLFAALKLAERDIKVQIVDKLRRTGLHGYALEIHPRTLELLDESGLASELIARGRRIDRIVFMEGDQTRRILPLSQLGGKFPFVLVIPQRELENALEARLRAAGVQVLWDHRLQFFQDQGDAVVSEIARLGRAPAGYPVARMEWVIEKILKTTSSFLIGADGYHSLVRTQLETPFEQVAPEETFAVFEFDAPKELGNDVRIITEPGRAAVLWPMADQRCRFSFQVESTEAAEATLADLNRLIDQRAPWFPRVDGPLHWSTLTHFDRRLVSEFGSGRIWLAGDAAHLTSPLAAQSLNAGLAEASTLAGLMAHVLEVSGTLQTLGSYDLNQQRTWRQMHGLGEPPVLQETGDHEDPWLRERGDTIRCSLPATGGDLQGLIGQLENDTSTLPSQAG